jgi:hypothetical protein
LLTRLYDHGFERGWWAKGSTVVDPFGGVGCGGVVAAYRGLRWIGCELELRFVALAEETFALHRGKWAAAGDVPPLILQGDSRNFAAVVACVTSPTWVDPRGRPAQDAQGDSRQFAAPAAGAAGVITSPPYADVQETRAPAAAEARRERCRRHEARRGRDPDAPASLPQGTYGTTPGQLGALPAGDAEAVLTSPPYADSVSRDSGGVTEGPGATSCHDPRKGGRRQTRDGCSSLPDYGATGGQLGALPAGNADSVITSPPYAEGLGHGGGKSAVPHTQAQGYGATPGNVGGLPAGDAGAVVTSPPYEECLAGAKNAPETKTARPHLPAAAQVAAYLKEMRKAKGLSKKQVDEYLGTNTMYSFFEGRKSRTEIPTPATWLKLKALLGLDDRFDRGILTEVEVEATGRHTTVRRGLSGHEYGMAEGQVGRESGETYWVACRTIYSECFKVLKPGGVMAVVVKAFTRKRAVVDLPGQTWRLLLSLGFTPVERIRCRLSEETREPSLFGGCEVKKRSRVSFFRRLATKRGAPEIPWEEILVVRRPLAGVP